MSHEDNHKKEALIKRINRIEGQIRGIRKMVETEKSFEEIIIQLHSTKAAIQKTSQILLEAHTDHMFMELAGEEALQSAQLVSLQKAINQYSKLL